MNLMKASRMYPDYRTKDQRKLLRRVFGPKYRRMFGPKYPKTWTPLPLERRFSAVEYDLIVAGHVSQSMDDHWNILFKDDTLYLYRSWTGVCMFRVRFVKTGDEYAVAGAAIGISPFADHIDHRAILSDVIDFVLLRKPSPFEGLLVRPEGRSRPWWKFWSNRGTPQDT